jgi:hypothetical protein
MASHPALTSDLFPAAPLRRDWRQLVHGIGERLAGTVAERQAADLVAAGFRRAGLSRVTVEEFPCRSLRSALAEVRAPRGSGWRNVPARCLVGAPGTAGWVEGPLVWLELPEQAARLRPDSLRGRILAVFGPLPTSVPLHRRLVAARPLAVIHVDDRLPFPWPKHDGVYPHWVRRHGMPPMLTVPYRDAWRWRVDGTDRLKVRVTVDLRDATSQNVIAELPGSEPALPPVVVTAHHDTQCGNPGADDNASGVVCLLALARALAGATRRRTVRLISFGTEEQLSVGSAAHVRRHRAQAARTGLVINLDSVSSPLGHWEMYVTGAPALAHHAQRRLTARGLPVVVHPEVIPFSDQFPFNRAGVPSLWFMRTNFPGGRWQHHSRHDTLANVSVTEVRRLLGAVHPLLVDLTRRRTWPFPSTVPASQLAAARRLGRELYG